MEEQLEEVPKEPFLATKLSELMKIFEGGGKILFPLIHTSACCSLEIQMAERRLQAVHPCRVGIDPSHCDTLIISGPINKKTLRKIKDIYKKLQAPKHVMAIGACAISGGPFVDDDHSGLEGHIPISLYLNGCPPTASEIKEALEKLLAMTQVIEEEEVIQ